jgi:hypothetical protein
MQQIRFAPSFLPPAAETGELPPSAPVFHLSRAFLGGHDRHRYIGPSWNYQIYRDRPTLYRKLVACFMG